jgi:hypothetical protein
MLRVRGVWPTPKRQQTAATKKPFGHFAASLGQSKGFHSKKRLKQLIARKQSLFDLGRKLEARRHRLA